MRRLQAFDPIERFTPRSRRLAGKPGDQVDIDVLDPALTKQRDIARHNLRRVLAACARDLALHEALHAQADAIDSALSPSREPAAGVSVPGAASIVASLHGLPGTAARISRRRIRRRSNSACRHRGTRFPAATATVPLDLPAKRVHVSRFHLARKNARRKIAVGALLRAERIGDVNPGHSVHDSRNELVPASEVHTILVGFCGVSHSWLQASLPAGWTRWKAGPQVESLPHFRNWTAAHKKSRRNGSGGSLTMLL